MRELGATNRKPPSSVLAIFAAATALAVAACVQPTAGAPSRTTDRSPLTTSASAGPANDGSTMVTATEPLGEPYSDDEFWEGVAPGGFNDENYGSLTEMTKAADVVLVGKAVSISQNPLRHTGVDPKDGAFAQVDFLPERVLAGTAETSAAGTVNLEFFMTDPAQFPRFSTRVPTGNVLVFLRNKAVEARLNGWPVEGPDTGRLYYRIVADQGVIRDEGGTAVAADDGGGFLSKINGTPFTTIVQQVIAASK